MHPSISDQSRDRVTLPYCICVGCDRAIPFECEQCGHIDETPAYQVAVHPAPVNLPPVDPAPVAAPAPALALICRATAPGVLSVTLNGVTFTVQGDLKYP
jgi:hypothetical protein